MKKKLILLVALTLCLALLTGCEFSFSTNKPAPVESNNITTTITTPEQNTTPEITYTEVKASSAKDIFQNVKPYTRIILTEGYYNTSFVDVATFQSDYVTVEDEFDGYEFIIHDVDHLEICAADNVMPEIVTNSPHSNVISLKNCNNIKIDGIVAGHEVEKGSCTGGVIYLYYSNDIEINNCHLYGCGIYGISSNLSQNVTVNNTDIYECSYGLVDLVDSANFTFNNCFLRDSDGYSMIGIRGSQNMTFNNCNVSGNKLSEYSSLISVSDSKSVTFNKCVFKGNTYQFFLSDYDDIVSFVGCKSEDVNYEQEYYYDVDPYLD